MSRVRIRVERAICGIKRARCVKDVLHNTHPECSDRFMETAKCTPILIPRHDARIDPQEDETYES